MTSSSDNQAPEEYRPVSTNARASYPLGSLDEDRMAKGNPMKPDLITEVYVRRTVVDKYVEGGEKSIMIEMESLISGRYPSTLLIEVDLDTIEGWSLDKHVYLLTLIPIR